MAQVGMGGRVLGRRFGGRRGCRCGRECRGGRGGVKSCSWPSLVGVRDLWQMKLRKGMGKPEPAHRTLVL